MCANDDTDEHLTCAEAALRRRADYQASKLPLTQPLPRHADILRNIPPGDEAPERSRDAKTHGTLWGYRRGCRSSRACPHQAVGKVTCNEARRRYMTAYRRRRVAGDGREITHGTSNGYYLGCRDRGSCPGDDAGVTCSDARAQYRRRTASAGTGSGQRTVSAHEAASLVRALRDQGHSLRSIAEMTGCGRTTIAEMSKPDGARRQHITPETLHRIRTAATAGTDRDR